MHEKNLFNKIIPAILIILMVVALVGFVIGILI
jgi:hypothetical protein